MQLIIDDIPVSVPDGVTLLEAAAAAGVTIPVLCHRTRYAHHPSCMVCMVQVSGMDSLVPACAMPAGEGMNVVTGSEEVKEARRLALELLLSDHSGDCEAPCRIACPAFMDIPQMNRLIAAGDFDTALGVVRQEIALPGILGHICPAPCENACRRKPIDGAVSICLLKRSTSVSGLSGALPVKPTRGRIAIAGAGPAGLSAAFYLGLEGYACILFDRNNEPGGALRYSIPADRLPPGVLAADIGRILESGAEFRGGVTVTAAMIENQWRKDFDAVILATGPGSLESFAPLLLPDDIGMARRMGYHSPVGGLFLCHPSPKDTAMAVQSAANGKKAALAVIRYLGGTGPLSRETGHGHPGAKQVSSLGKLRPSEWPEYLQEADGSPVVTASAGWTVGYTRQEAMQEALRCMRCDCRKPVTCKLRNCSEKLGVYRKRIQGLERNPVTRSLQHDIVVFETEKCIRCGLCVEISTKHGESFGMAFTGRGYEVRIGIPFGKTLSEGLTRAAAECVEACPTGALAFRNREERRPG